MIELIMHPETGLIVVLVTLVNVNLVALVVLLLRQDHQAVVTHSQEQEIDRAKSSMTRSKVVLMRPAR